MDKNQRESGYAGLLGLLITVAIILILTTLYFVPGEDTGAGPEGKTKTIPVAERANQATLRVKLIGVQQSIQSFKAIESRFPESLDELRTDSSYSIQPLPPGYEYVYDPASGTVVIAQEGKTVCP